MDGPLWAIEATLPPGLRKTYLAKAEQDWEALGRQSSLLYNSAVKLGAEAPQIEHALSGRFYISYDSDDRPWGLVAVPNALGRGAFDALNAVGVELPKDSHGGPFNAHITVLHPADIEHIGGPAKISERGHSFKYTLGPVKSVSPDGWLEVSKCWFIEVNSPELKDFRKSYGLSALPKGDHPFHITFAVRKRSVLRPNAVTKSAAEGEPPEGTKMAGEGIRYEDIPYGAALGGATGSVAGLLVSTYRRLMQEKDEKTKKTRSWLDLAAEDVPYMSLLGAGMGGLRPVLKPAVESVLGPRKPPFDPPLVVPENKTAGLNLGGYPVTIDRPKGYKKTFTNNQGPIVKEYPTDYGYLNDRINPEDDEEVDVFLGSKGRQHGRFMKGNTLEGPWRPDETKWYANLNLQQLAAVKEMFQSQHPELLADFRQFKSKQELLADILASTRPKTAALAKEATGWNTAARLRYLDPAARLRLGLQGRRGSRSSLFNYRSSVPVETSKVERSIKSFEDTYSDIAKARRSGDYYTGAGGREGVAAEWRKLRRHLLNLPGGRGRRPWLRPLGAKEFDKVPPWAWSGLLVAGSPWAAALSGQDHPASETFRPPLDVPPETASETTQQPESAQPKPTPTPDQPTPTPTPTPDQPTPTPTPTPDQPTSTSTSTPDQPTPTIDPNAYGAWDAAKDIGMAAGGAGLGGLVGAYFSQPWDPDTDPESQEAKKQRTLGTLGGAGLGGLAAFLLGTEAGRNALAKLTGRAKTAQVKEADWTEWFRQLVGMRRRDKSWKDQPASDHVAKMRYELEPEDLYVTYRGKGDDAEEAEYAYHGVPYQTADAIRSADNVGKAIWDKLRVRGSRTAHKFPYERVT